MTGVVFGTVLPWLFVVAGLWVVLKLIGQNGRMLLRLEGIEGRLSQLVVPPQKSAAAPELPIGSPAPGFELPSLAGGRRSLADFQGKPVLLVFFSPQCGFCTRILPDLAGLPADGASGRPVPLVVTNGDAAENRRLFREHKVGATVLLQEQMTTAARYHVQGTPIGYLIDAQGKIASRMSVGAEAIMALADPNSGKPEKAKTGKGNRDLATSKLNREGLKSGTPAPSFRLPRVGGGELALEDYRGRVVLLVFSDPQCGPCDVVAPELESRHRQATGVEVLMVSRRDMDRNRRKMDEKGLTFPIGVQKNWDVSMLYGMFSTPIAYLIDERGVLVSDVKVGVGPILDLFDSVSGVPRNGVASHEMAAGTH